MGALTASSILRAMDRHRAQSEIAALSDLDEQGAQAVRRALTGVHPGSRIDLPVLIAEVRRDIDARAAAEVAKQPDALAILKFRLGLASKGQLVELRRELRAEERTSVALHDIMGKLDAIARRMAGTEPRARLAPAVEPDVEPDDDLPENDKPRRRGVPRCRSRREAEPEPATESASPAKPSKPAKPAPLLHGRVFGPGADARPFGCPDSVHDYDGWRDPTPPAWLLPDEQTEAATP